MCADDTELGNFRSLDLADRMQDGKYFAIISSLRVLAFCILILAVPCRGVATEVVSISNEFMISRDFSRIVIKGSDVQAARVFVDPVRMVSPSENAELHQIATNLLRDKLQIVSNKESANYLVQIIMQQQRDYAIRNPKRESAHGFILISICKYPIKEVANDCENLTYFYFDDYKKIDLFTKVFNMWVDTVVPSQVK